jgi:predicted ATPase
MEVAVVEAPATGAETGPTTLKRVEFENFMSLRNVSVDLEPLTIFIGPNASGKSAILKGLVTVSKLLGGLPLRGDRGDFSLEEGVTFEDLVWSGDSGLPVRFRVWFEDDTQDPSYSLEIRKDRAGWSVTREKFRAGAGWIEVDEDHPFEHASERRGTVVHEAPMRASLRYLVYPYRNDRKAREKIEPILQLAERFGQALRYRPSASDIASFVRTGEQRVFVKENGWGLAGELYELLGTSREIVERIERAVQQVFPHIKRIKLNRDRPGIRLSFETDRSEDSVPAPQESDGALLATFLFWRMLTAKPSLKVCLEEPENGLHPLLLAARFKLLKQFAYGEEGHSKLQLLVATHSPEFLRALKAHPTALFKHVRVVEYHPGEGTKVRGLDHYREATKLIDDYLNDVHERWSAVVQGWGQ